MSSICFNYFRALLGIVSWHSNVTRFKHFTFIELFLFNRILSSKCIKSHWYWPVNVFLLFSLYLPLLSNICIWHLALYKFLTYCNVIYFFSKVLCAMSSYFIFFHKTWQNAPVFKLIVSVCLMNYVLKGLYLRFKNHFFLLNKHTFLVQYCKSMKSNKEIIKRERNSKNTKWKRYTEVCCGFLKSSKYWYFSI